jgi:hypothetical protein
MLKVALGGGETPGDIPDIFICSLSTASQQLYDAVFTHNAV